MWLARYRKEPRQARHSQQPGVIDWLADACMSAFTGCAGQLAAAIAPSTTRWPAGIWRVNRGVAAIRPGGADTPCSSHCVADSRDAAETWRRHLYRPNSVDTGSNHSVRQQAGTFGGAPSLQESWSTFPPGPRILVPSPHKGVHAIDGSLRLDLAACVLRLGFCERFFGSTRRRYLINAQSPCPGLLGDAAWTCICNSKLCLPTNRCVGLAHLASPLPNLVYLLLLLLCIYLYIILHARSLCLRKVPRHFIPVRNETESSFAPLSQLRKLLDSFSNLSWARLPSATPDLISCPRTKPS